MWFQNVCTRMVREIILTANKQLKIGVMCDCNYRKRKLEYELKESGNVVQNYIKIGVRYGK